jgi:hypothetical protein
MRLLLSVGRSAGRLECLAPRIYGAAALRGLIGAAAPLARLAEVRILVVRIEHRVRIIHRAARVIAMPQAQRVADLVNALLQQPLKERVVVGRVAVELRTQPVQRAQTRPTSEPKKSCPRALFRADFGTARGARTTAVARNRSSRHSESRVSKPPSIALIGTMLISRTADETVSGRPSGGPGRPRHEMRYA